MRIRTFKGNGEVLSAAVFSIVLCSFLFVLGSFVQYSSALNAMRNGLQAIARQIAVCESLEDATAVAQATARLSLTNQYLSDVKVMIDGVNGEDAKDWGSGIQKSVTLSCDVKTIDPWVTSGVRSKTTMITLEANTVGENQIPETYEGKTVGANNYYTCTQYRYNGWGAFQTPWGTGSGQKRVWMKWRENPVYDRHVATIDGYYLIACSQLFGSVGDQVTFYFDNGEKLETVIMDIKSKKDPNYTIYGHSDGNNINVIEFETDLVLNPVRSGYFPEIYGARPTSWTNNGKLY